MTDEQRQAIKFEDAIGAVIDTYLRAGMSPETIQKSLQFQAGYAPERKAEMESAQ